METSSRAAFGSQDWLLFGTSQIHLSEFFTNPRTHFTLRRPENSTYIVCRKSTFSAVWCCGRSWSETEVTFRRRFPPNVTHPGGARRRGWVAGLKIRATGHRRLILGFRQVSPRIRTGHSKTPVPWVQERRNKQPEVLSLRPKTETEKV